MNIVVDTNILFSWFKNTAARSLLQSELFTWFVPEYAFEELRRHTSLIKKKCSLSQSGFTRRLDSLKNRVSVHSVTSKSLRHAYRFSPDVDDSDFFALALDRSFALWSLDKKLYDQDVVAIFSTKLMIEMSEVLHEYHLYSD